MTFKSNDYIIIVASTCKNWRIDHCSFISTTSACAVQTNGYTYGVIDHCFIRQAEILVQDDNNSWNRPLVLGTSNAVYIEDCESVGSINQDAIDGLGGGRFVFRHNTLTDMMLQCARQGFVRIPFHVQL